MIGPIAASHDRESGMTTANPLERLVRIMQGNDRLMEELEIARGRIVMAREALTTPAGKTRFAAQYLDHCKTKHRGILAQLRSNRIEAGEILGLDLGHVAVGR